VSIDGWITLGYGVAALYGVIAAGGITVHQLRKPRHRRHSRRH
jgi:hypothetical protein